MQIGLLTSQLDHGSGWAHYSLSLIAAYQRVGLPLTVISAENSPHLPGQEVARWLPSLSPSRRFLVARMALLTPRLRARLRDCDLIHAMVEPYALAASWAAGDRPLVITAHGTYTNLPRMRAGLVGELYRRAFARSTLVCVSRYTAQVAAEVVPGVRTQVVNNGIDPERFHDLPALPEPRTGPVILSTGGVKKRKGTLHLVRAMAQVRQHFPDAQCVVIGRMDAEPGYTQRVMAEIASLNLSDCVHLLGFVPDETVRGWYGAADLFVLPSINSGYKFEGFGLVHLEASAAGLPVIGTTGCGVEDAIEHDVTGLLVDQDAIDEQLPGAILGLLNDPERARRMGEAGQRKARQQTWDRVAAQMIELYQARLSAR